MDLNRLGSGKELVKQVMNAGRTSKMGWTPQQQAELLANRKNPHNQESRKK